MYRLDLTLSDPAANLALDEALLLAAEAGQAGEGLRFWESPYPAVILGAGCRLSHDVDEGACRLDGVPILRRASGGGTVLLGPGCLCYSLVLSYDRDAAFEGVRSSCAFILDRLRLALAGLCNDIELAGTSDLAMGSRKFSGNAQERKRRFLLHHGTILYRFDTASMEPYLRMPARRPDYRRERSHVDFLSNFPADPADLKNRISDAWQANTTLSDWPRAMVARLVEQKYATEAWTKRFL
jgi:lipoate---protein ligase